MGRRAGRAGFCKRRQTCRESEAEFEEGVGQGIRSGAVGRKHDFGQARALAAPRTVRVLDRNDSHRFWCLELQPYCKLG